MDFSRSKNCQRGAPRDLQLCHRLLLHISPLFFIPFKKTLTFMIKKIRNVKMGCTQIFKTLSPTASFHPPPSSSSHIFFFSLPSPPSTPSSFLLLLFPPSYSPPAPTLSDVLQAPLPTTAISSSLSPPATALRHHHIITAIAKKCQKTAHISWLS